MLSEIPDNKGVLSRMLATKQDLYTPWNEFEKNVVLSSLVTKYHSSKNVDVRSDLFIVL